MRTLTILALLGTLGVAAVVTKIPGRDTLADGPPAAAPAPRPAPAWTNTSWLNADGPVTLEALKGRVVLLNFWVFTCYNCTNTVPSLTTFDRQFRDKGLTIIGIHTPEFPPYAGEHDRENLAKALRKQHIEYPNAQDNDRTTWKQYGIRYWPSFVLIDKQGQIRDEGFGEFHVGDPWHREWERRINALLAEQVLAGDALVSLVARDSGAVRVLELRPTPGGRINAQLTPTLELATGERLSLLGQTRTADSAYFADVPRVVVAPERALGGTLRASVCPANARVCLTVALRVAAG